MPDAETYDVWVINDADGPVLYVPVPSASSDSPADHVARHRQHAARTTPPEGLIEGVWSRARQRLASGEGLVAEIADPEVEVRRAAQRAATMARGADAAAWAPDELLATPEPAPTKKAGRRTAARVSSSSGTSRPRPAPTPRRRPKPTPRPPARPKPAEPEERMCPSCFMMRRADQFEGDLCAFCA